MAGKSYGSSNEKAILSPIEEMDSARALLQFLRLQQHDFMNHIQVIHGYLQLNKAHKAIEYIEDIIVQKQNLSAIYKLQDPGMSACLLSGLHKAAFHQVELKVILDSDWPLQANSRRIAALCTELLYVVIEAAASFSGKAVTARLFDSTGGQILRLELPYDAEAPQLAEELQHLCELAATVGCVISRHEGANLLQIICEINRSGNKDKMGVAEKS